MSDDGRPAGGDDREEDEDRPDEPLVERYRRYEERYRRYEETFQPDEDDLAPESPGPDDIPADVKRSFWSAVASVNVGLLAASLGVMFVGFRGNWRLGGALVAVGIAALAWTYYKYRRFQSRDDDADGETAMRPPEGGTGDGDRKG